MQNSLASIYEFIQIAEKNRIYPANTATARRTALKLFEQELSDQEKESFDIFKENFEKIYQAVFNKNK